MPQLTDLNITPEFKNFPETKIRLEETFPKAPDMSNMSNMSEEDKKFMYKLGGLSLLVAFVVWVAFVR